jgi:hypothetical protein
MGVPRRRGCDAVGRSSHRRVDRRAAGDLVWPDVRRVWTSSQNRWRPTAWGGRHDTMQHPQCGSEGKRRVPAEKMVGVARLELATPGPPADLSLPCEATLLSGVSYPLALSISPGSSPVGEGRPCRSTGAWPTFACGRTLGAVGLAAEAVAGHGRGPAVHRRASHRRRDRHPQWPCRRTSACSRAVRWTLRAVRVEHGHRYGPRRGAGVDLREAEERPTHVT